MKEKEWLKNYFQEKGTLPPDYETVNFFEAGMIDSLGVIQLVEALESKFEISFTEKNFQDRRFSSISGLAEIICELKNG